MTDFTVEQEIKINIMPSLYERQYENKFRPKGKVTIVIFAVKDGVGYALEKTNNNLEDLQPYNGCYKLTSDGEVKSRAWSAYPKEIRDIAIKWYREKYHERVV